MATNRSLPVAAVFASAVAAGVIASRNGRATVTPMPLRTARRDRCRFVMIILVSMNARLSAAISYQLSAIGDHRSLIANRQSPIADRNALHSRAGPAVASTGAGPLI